MAKHTRHPSSGGFTDQAMEDFMFKHSGCFSSPVLKAARSLPRGVASDRLIRWLSWEAHNLFCVMKSCNSIECSRMSVSQGGFLKSLILL